MNETLVILQEEAAEVIQAISKIHRFGIDNHCPITGESSLETLHKELGDLQCMINLCIEQGLIKPLRLQHYTVAKREKLKIWSNIAI
jgi:NTP pyrophosphatase (non-canonical NTP hydrolase)